MRHFLAILAALIICATAQAQTVKALMYNTNGAIVYNNTNRLTFSQQIELSNGLYNYGDFFMVDGSTITADGYLGAMGDWTFGGTVDFSFPGLVRPNLGFSTNLNALWTATNAIGIRQAIGLQSYTNTLTNSVNNVEIGSTVSNVTVGWTIAPTEATYAVRTLVGASQTNSITNNSSTLARTNLTLTSNTTWTLTVGDGFGVTNTATTAVNFLNYMMWGRSTNTTLDNTAIQNLHTNGGDRVFATSRNRSFSIDGGGQFIFIAYPAGFGSASFTVGGLPNTAFTLTTNSYTNASGYVTNYLIYRTDTIQNGTGINFVVQ